MAYGSAERNGDSATRPVTSGGCIGSTCESCGGGALHVLNSGSSTCLVCDDGGGGGGGSAVCKMISGPSKSVCAVSSGRGDYTVTLRRSPVSACEGKCCCILRRWSTNSDSDNGGGGGGVNGATRIYAMILGGY